MTADELIKACRDSTQKPIFSDDLQVKMNEMGSRIGNLPALTMRIRVFAVTAHGLIMPPEAGDTRDQETVAGMITAAKTASIEMAGAALRDVLFCRAMYADLNIPAELAATMEALRRRAQRDPQIACIGIVAALQAMRLFKDFPHCEAYRAVMGR